MVHRGLPKWQMHRVHWSNDQVSPSTKYRPSLERHVSGSLGLSAFGGSTPGLEGVDTL